MINYEIMGAVRIAVAIFLLSFYVHISEAYGQESKFDFRHVTAETITKDDLLEDIMSMDQSRIIETLSSIQSMYDYEYHLPFLRDLWEQKEDKDPGLPWHIVRNDEVKIKLAALFINAGQFFDIGDLDISIANFLRGLVDGPARLIANEAVINLSQLNKEPDVELLYSIALDHDSTRFRSAVIGLSMMCLPSAARALDKLGVVTTDVDVRQYIEDTRAELRAFRQLNRWCQ